ncbi:MAG: UDP-N-acetylmuramoyl-L-alanine--D-glutamate ligase [Gammaproteobacteria bacterium]|nr:UDP-N-acetylmuramoyl-L-alanine--D-glutamate ligase [Gammaproteobacteria bacterium]
MKRTAIIGLGITGVSALRYLYGHDELVVLDTRAEPPNAAAVRREFPDAQYRFDVQRYDYVGVDRVVVSPGVALGSCLVEAARKQRVELISDIDLFCQAARAPIIAITGTNGKSTVTSLVGHLLQALGNSPGVGGNLGQPALDLLDEARDSYVIELSSFQLERLGRHHFRAATILNVSEDHLDRHGSLRAYQASKQRIYRDCRLVVANRMDRWTLPDSPVELGERQLVSFGLDAPGTNEWGIVDGRLSRGADSVLAVEDLPIAGLHNALNVLAAFALVWSDGVDTQVLADAARAFTGLPHRCERIADVDGVNYVDDSKATNIGATLAALHGLGSSLQPNLVLIAGGEGKDADFAPLREPVGRFVKHVILLGVDAAAIEAALDSVVPVSHVESLAAAVARASSVASRGDLVLLSPACASFDMFENFSDRGEHFAAAVRELAA